MHVRSPPMKMGLLSQSASCLNIAMMITVAATSLIVAIAILYITGSYLGYPFGQFILRSIPNTQHVQIQTRDQQYHTVPQQSQLAQEDDVNPNYTASAFSEHAMARGLGAMLVFFLCFMALLMELVSEGNKDNTGEANGWHLWRMEGVLFRVCVEGLLTLVLLRGIGRVVYLALGY